MKKKSFLSGVIPLLLSVALCACGGDKGAEAASTAEESRTGGNTAQEPSSVEESSNTLQFVRRACKANFNRRSDAGSRERLYGFR